mmetsp:Transcript_43849/g.91257  ORF Transcript_43849/g.91257 Transcript_43849/m.91257 type:complete len:605 (+) Transcript_43849:956-2770(+)
MPVIRMVLSYLPGYLGIGQGVSVRVTCKPAKRENFSHEEFVPFGGRGHAECWGRSNNNENRGRLGVVGGIGDTQPNGVLPGLGVSVDGSGFLRKGFVVAEIPLVLESELFGVETVSSVKRNNLSHVHVSRIDLDVCNRRNVVASRVTDSPDVVAFPHLEYVQGLGILVGTKENVHHSGIVFVLLLLLQRRVKRLVAVLRTGRQTGGAFIVRIFHEVVNRVENEIGVNVLVFRRPNAFRDKGSSCDATPLAIGHVFVIIEGVVVLFSLQNDAGRIVEGTVAGLAKFAWSLVLRPPVVLSGKIGSGFANLLPDRSTNIVHVKSCLLCFGRVQHNPKGVSEPVAENFRADGTVGSIGWKDAPVLSAGNTVVPALEGQRIVGRDASVLVQSQNGSVQIGEVLRGSLPVTATVSGGDIELAVVAEFYCTPVVKELVRGCSLHENFFRFVHDAERLGIHGKTRQPIARSKVFVLQAFLRIRCVVNVQPHVLRKVWMRNDRLHTAFSVGTELVLDVEDLFGGGGFVGVCHHVDEASLHAKEEHRRFRVGFSGVWNKGTGESSLAGHQFFDESFSVQGASAHNGAQRPQKGCHEAQLVPESRHGSHCCGCCV